MEIDKEINQSARIKQSFNFPKGCIEQGKQLHLIINNNNNNGKPSTIVHYGLYPLMNRFAPLHPYSLI